MWQRRFLIIRKIFQSTPSAWRETCRNISRRNESRISIHSLRMEGDPSTTKPSVVILIFQSTPSAWRETCIPISRILQTCHFNPLPPHGGRRGFFVARNIYWDFNPLPPHGGRRTENACTCTDSEISIHSLRMEGDRRMNPQKFPPVTFQSTPSAWRETTSHTVSEYRR